MKLHLLRLETQIVLVNLSTFTGLQFLKQLQMYLSQKLEQGKTFAVIKISQGETELYTCFTH